MPGFGSRSALSVKMNNCLNSYLTNLGFLIHPMGYENYFPSALMQRLRLIHNLPSVTYARYIPDNFAFFNDTTVFWLEYKICNTPIRLDSRVNTLQSLSRDRTLSKSNIGAIETAALQVYKGLATLGIKILVVIYSPYHKRGETSAPLIADFADSIIIKHQDSVVQGTGNASWTPYSNINMNEFRDFKSMIQELTGLQASVIDQNYESLITCLTT